jgi:hypothetical protein
MALRYPSRDPRRARALREALERIAPALAPEWEGLRDAGTFGRGIFEIAARLGEETTRRLDRTAQRDAAAFFHELEIPPTAPMAAEAVIVLTLADRREAPVFAPPRVQVAAEVGGEEVIFETRDALALTPARLSDLVTVDTTTDRIERAPEPVISIVAPDERTPEYQVASFADTGSQTLQVSPSIGLAEGDLIRVGGAVYRVREVEDDLVGLIDPLDAPAAAGALVVKVASLEAFDLRDLQSHVFYVGHSELFNLEQPARISLQFSPPSLARRLSELNVVYALWGTIEGEEQPGWHELGQAGASGSTLHLTKSWVGSVDETEVEAVKSRWLRAVLEDTVADRASLGARASRLAIIVRSNDPAAATPDPSAEGSQTIAQAFHNSTPLSLASRFFPFGPEPQRFDTFAFAAPEALSKKGARVTLKVRLVDASLAALDLAVIAHGPPRAYGIGKNGFLQALAFESDGTLRWQELDPPAALDDGGETDAASLHLDGDKPVHAVEISKVGSTLHDMVLALDKAGHLWAGRVNKRDSSSDAFEPADWTNLPDLPDGVDPEGIVAVPNPGPIATSTSVVLFAPGDGALRALRLNSQAHAIGTWVQVTSTDPAQPDLLGAARLAAVQAQSWPSRAPGPALLVALIDGLGAVWRASVNAATLIASWMLLDADAARTATPDVRPVATLFETGSGQAGFWVAWARASDRSVVAYREVNNAATFIDAPPDNVTGSSFVASAGTALLSDPRALDFEGEQPLTTAFGEDDTGLPVVMVWGREDDLRFSSLPDGGIAGLPPAFLLPQASNGLPDLVFGGPGEILFSGAVRSLSRIVGTELFDRLRLDGAAQAAHYVEVRAEMANSLVLGLLNENKIVEVPVRVYRIDPAAGLQVGDPYRFLRRLDNNVANLQGTVDAVDRSQFKLDGTDATTVQDKRIIIDDASYYVSAIAGGTATLDRDVAGTNNNVTYTPVSELATGNVAARDLRTLVHLPDEAARPRMTALRFTGADPAIQPLVLADDQPAQGVWLLLDQAWVSAPPDAVPAELLLDLAITEWTSRNLERGYQNPELSWEYFDGDGWRRLEDAFIDGTQNLATSGDVVFDVPDQIAETDVAGQADYWIRARLVGGDYGRAKYVVKIETSGTTSTQTITVDTSELRPPEIASIEAFFELTEPVAPERLLVRNNLATLDQTQASAVDQARFELFEGVLAIDDQIRGRALYLGFTKPIDVNPLVMLADVGDRPGLLRMRADVLTRLGWRRATVKDETQCLNRRGMISVFLNVAAVRARLFGTEGFWVRLRPEDDAAAEDWAPVVRGLYPNAARASQAKTIEQEILGSSLGEPNTTFELSETPVLPESLELRVRERLSDEELGALEEDQRQRFAPPGAVEDPEVVTGFANAPGDWVLWRRVDSFVGQDGDARVYRVDPATGTVTFGDNRHGRIPPAGRDAVRAFIYQSGGGRIGNVPAWTKLKTKSAVEAVDAVVLPIDAAGGVDTPDTDAQIATAPARLRHGGRALTRADLEALAVASSPDIVRARCFSPEGSNDPIRVAIAARNGSRYPIPSLAQCDAVGRYLQEAGWGGLGDMAIQVSGPVYVRLKVGASLTAAADRVAVVEDGATRALSALMHPIDGGPDGTGWPFGRRVWPSDLLRALSAVDGAGRIEDVTIETLDGTISLDSLAADALVCAEEADIDVRVVPETIS